MTLRSVMRLLVFVWAASWLVVVEGQNNRLHYCKFTPLHTLCLHSGLGPRCGNQVEFRGVHSADSALIVQLHNQLRSRVATGGEARGAPGPQPPAANMLEMEWDQELATVAQSHADQCIFEHECSACRRVDRFEVGQNLLITFQTRHDPRVSWRDAIESWFEEVDIFNPASIQPFRIFNKVGHYTQMMWWNSFRIGCGFTMSFEGPFWRKLYTCNYGPAGNYLGRQMYLSGPPCSSCPIGSFCSPLYPGLCRFEFPGTVGIQKRSGSSLLSSSIFGMFPIAGQRHETPVNQRQEREAMQKEDDDKKQVFVPFNGERPKATDLVPLLKQLGIKAELIQKSSTSNLMSFLDELPPEVQSAVFIRSGNGQLTQTDNGTLFSCDLNSSPCELMPYGGNWTVGRDSGGLYLASVLQVGERTGLSHQMPITAPATKSICISKSHRLQVEAEGPLEALYPRLEVSITSPADGEMFHKVLDTSFGKWEVSKMSVDQVQSPFFVSVSVTPPASGMAKVAIESLKITDGLC